MRFSTVPTSFSSLRQRSFRYLWIGQTISRFGDRIYEIALAWYILSRTHSPTAMGAVLIASFLPTIVLLLIGGVVADRLPRLAIMLASDLARGLLVLAMTILLWINLLSFWVILSIAFCFGVMDAFFGPAYSAVVPEIVPTSALASANALRVLSGRAMAILGPTLGAGLIAVGGTRMAFAVNSLTFFFSAICLTLAIARAASTSWRPRTPERESRAMSITAFLHALHEGGVTVRTLPWIWITIILAGVANLFGSGAASVALPFYVEQTLHSPLLYGWLTAATAAGSITAAIWYGGRTWRHRGPLIYSFFMANFLVLSAIGAFPIPPVILGAMFLYGLCETMLGLAWMTALQEYVPNEQMGRVTSLDQFGSYVGIPLSYALGGVLTSFSGSSAVLLWSGLLATGTVSLGWLSRSVRQLD